MYCLSATIKAGILTYQILARGWKSVVLREIGEKLFNICAERVHWTGGNKAVGLLSASTIP